MLVDGLDVRDHDLHHLRSQIAMVAQDTVLLEGTLRDNLVCGRPGVTDREVARAAELALVDEFARNLPDGLDTRLGERGADLSGGRRRRGDMPAAANLLRRAADLLPTFDDFRVGLLTDLGEALLDVGEFAEAERVLGEAMSAAEEMGDQRLAADAALVLMLVRMYSGSADWGEGALAEAHRAIPVLEEHGDEAGLAKAWRVIGAVHGVACRYGEAAPAVEQAIVHARAAGDVRQERRNAAAYALAALYGPTPVPEAIERCERIVAESAGDRRSEGLALCALGQLEAMRGDFERARERVARARDDAERPGRQRARRVDLHRRRRGRVPGRRPGRRRAAAARSTSRCWRRWAPSYLLSTVRALLAQALCEQGRLDEAEASLAVTRELAEDDDIESQAYLRRIGAEIAVARGDRRRWRWRSTHATCCATPTRRCCWPTRWSRSPGRRSRRATRTRRGRRWTRPSGPMTRRATRSTRARRGSFAAPQRWPRAATCRWSTSRP